MNVELTATIREAMPLAAHLGFEGVEDDAGAIVLRGAWAPEHCTAAGVLIEAKTNFLAAVRHGSVTARAELVHAGTRTIVLQVDITDDDGRLVSRTLQTQAVIAG
jgi:1,4-dihydroxy-2-naphthoyl-CoA hydrolase